MLDRQVIVEPTTSREKCTRKQVMELTESHVSAELAIGDVVLCAFGRGRVVEVRPSGKHVVVRLSSWRLAGHSSVTCFIHSSKVRVALPKQINNMSVLERVEYAQGLTEKAEKDFAAKDYTSALLTYTRAFGVVRDLQDKSDSSNDTWIDLVKLIVICSSKITACQSKLQQWSEAHNAAQIGLFTIDALEHQRGWLVNTLSNRLVHPTLFCEWRVDIFLVMGRTLTELHRNEEALEVLEKARCAVAKYTAVEYEQQHSLKASVQRLMAKSEDVNQLQDECQRQLNLKKRKAERKKLRQWTRDMFGSSSRSTCSPSKKIPAPELVSLVARNVIEQSDDVCVHEVIGYAQGLKRKAEKEFASKNYNSALLTSTIAIDAAQDIKDKAGSITLQLTAATIMIACSIRAAACCRKLDRWDEAEAIAGKALVMICNALEQKPFGSTCTRVSETSNRYRFNFGEQRVKSFLVLARVSIRMQKYEDAIKIFDNAHEVSAKYVAFEYAQEASPKASTGCLLSSEEDGISVSLCKDPQEPESSEERQATQESLGSLPCVSIDDGEIGNCPQLVCPEQSCIIKRVGSPLLGDSLPKRIKKEELAHDVLDSSPLATDDEDEEKKEHGDQQEIPQVRESVPKVPGMHQSTSIQGLSSSKTKQSDHVEMTMTDWRPRAPDNKVPVEFSDPKLIFSVSRSAIEATRNCLLRERPSLGSTPCSDSSISSDGQTTNRKVGSSTSTESPGGSVIKVSFCTSPPQVREYERYVNEGKQPSTTHNGTPIEFNNLNKKRRMLKKNLDKLNGDDTESAEAIQGTQTVTRIAKQVGLAFLQMNAFVLTQRR